MVKTRFAAVVVGLTFVLGCNGSSSRSSDNSSLVGTSSGPGAIEVSPASLDYGEGLIGDPRTLDVRVKNRSDSEFLALSSHAISQDSSPDFEITSGPTSVVIAPLAEIVISVRYVASDQGSDTGTLVIRSDDPDTPVINVSLLGSGISTAVPDIDISPLSLAFGDVFFSSS